MGYQATLGVLCAPLQKSSPCGETEKSRAERERNFRFNLKSTFLRNKDHVYQGKETSDRRHSVKVDFFFIENMNELLLDVILFACLFFLFVGLTIQA